MVISQSDATQTSEPSVGESWAYRAHTYEPLVEVQVARVGVKRPRRVLVRFVDDEFEGREEWVPPGRLKARWQDLAAFTARESQWAAVIGASPERDSPEESAAVVVFDLLIDPGIATLGYNATGGVVTICDLTGLAAYLGLDPADLLADRLSFEENGCVVAPWPITRLIATRAAERDPDSVLRYVDREEDDARRDAIAGRHYPRRGRADPWDVSAEICVQVDEAHGKPVRAILRQWCGVDAVGIRAELAELRKDLRWLLALTESAADALRRSGAPREASSIDRQLREYGYEPVRDGAGQGNRLVGAVTRRPPALRQKRES